MQVHNGKTQNMERINSPTTTDTRSPKPQTPNPREIFFLLPDFLEEPRHFIVDILSGDFYGVIEATPAIHNPNPWPVASCVSVSLSLIYLFTDIYILIYHMLASAQSGEQVIRFEEFLTTRGMHMRGPKDREGGFRVGGPEEMTPDINQQRPLGAAQGLDRKGPGKV